MKKKSTPAQSKTLGYESFLRSVKLYALALDGISANLDREKYWKYSKQADTLVREIAASYKAMQVEGNHFDVEAKFELTIGTKNNNGAILGISCKYNAHFHAAPDCNKEFADRFAKSEARVIVWPYFRHLVADLTSRMHIPPITIPLALD